MHAPGIDSAQVIVVQAQCLCAEGGDTMRTGPSKWELTLTSERLHEPICLSVCVSACLLVCLSVCPYARPSVCLSVRLSGPPLRFLSG